MKGKWVLWALLVASAVGGYVAVLGSLRSSLSRLRGNQELLVSELRQMSDRLHALEQSLELHLSQSRAMPETPVSSSAGAVETASTPGLGSQLPAIDPAQWPFLNPADLPAHFVGRFPSTDVFFDLGDGAIARLSLPDGFDPYASQETRAVAEELLLAFLSRHDHVKSEIARRVSNRQFEAISDASELSKRCEEMKAAGKSPGVQELPQGGWAVVDLTGVTKGGTYEAASEKVMSLPDVLGVASAEFGVYPADHRFTE